MKYVSTFLTLLVVYLLLTFNSSYEWVSELIIGSVVSLVITVGVVHFVPFTWDLKLPLRVLLFIFMYVPVFLYALVLANIDVARRVLSPKIPLHPAFIKVKTDLESDFAIFLLANSITLTPGTLSVDVVDHEIIIHAVSFKGTSQKDRQNVTALFEKVLKVVFK
jgi:multicomponent Na+:H+ antiporter subunit E